MTLLTATAMFFGALSTDALASGARVTAGRPLSLALKADGSPRHIHGSFDARGYRLILGKNGAPRFVRAPATRRTDLAAPVPSPLGRSALTAALNPADASWSDSFDNVGLANAPTVLAVAISGSNLYVGGSFTSISRDAGTVFNNVAMWNGHGWHALGSGTNGEVDAVAVSGANIYFGGKFSSAGGAPASSVARWNGTGWSALGAGVSNPTSGTLSVNALAVSGTTVYAGGTFDQAGTVVAHSIAAWDGTNWSALGTGIQDCGYFDTPNHCFSTPGTGEVDALLVSGSTLYAGGRFQYVGGTTLFSLAAWNGAAWSSVNGVGASRSGASGAVYALAANGGTLYVGGQFDHVGGALSSGTITGAVPAASVASLTGSKWIALGGGAEYCCGPAIVTSLAFRSARLYMGGTFTGAGGDGAPYLGQWNGTGWSAVGGGTDGSGPTALVSSSSGVIALGTFTAAGAGAVTLNHIGLWTGTRWTGYGLGVSGGPGSGNVRVAAASNHTLYVGGGFTTAGSTPVTNISQFDGTSWSNMAGGVSGALAQPYAIAINGKSVYVGGSFTAAGTVPASNIAMWDGVAWHALGSAGGGGGVDGDVNALLFYNGKLWVGGAFLHAGGGRASGVATWDPVAQKWAAVGGDLNIDNGTVNALTGVTDTVNSSNNHYVIIGGSFTQADDGASPTPVTKQVNGLLIFDTTATIAKPFDGYGVTPGTGGSVGVAGAVAALYADGLKIYVGGSFGTAGGVTSQGFALYDLSVAPPNGWSSPGAVGGATATVEAITKAGSSLYLAGDFTTAGPVSAMDVAQYTPTTRGWAALGSGLGGSSSINSAHTLASSADGLYVGGSFGLAGAKASQNVGLWTKTAFPLTVTEVGSPASAAVDSPVTFSATVKNTAATSATGVVMSESLPGTVQFVSASPSQGTCTRSGYSLSCSVGTLAAGASVTVAIKIIPVYPGAVTNVVTAMQSGSTNTNTATATTTATAQPATSYAQLRDTGALPSSLLVAPGQTVQFDFFGPSQHSAKDGSPLALFDSGAKLPVSYYSFRYMAAGTYPVLDAFSAHTISVGVHDTLSATRAQHATGVTVTMSAVAPAAGYALDLQVLLPGATTWTPARSGVTTASTTYTPALAGTYQLRSRLRDVATNGSSAYSPPVNLTAT